MSEHSQIEWTDATWNPTRGCDKISPGCAHCYAETFAERFRGVKGHPYEQGFDLRLVPEKLAEPLRWKKPRMIFVNSMSDLFHKDVLEDYVQSVVRVMRLASWHTYQVLTKRSERMRDLLQTRLFEAAREPHIWWGVSVENRKHGLPRIDHLRAAPACVRFLSIEPLLEDLGEVDLEGIHWVIVGGRKRTRSQTDGQGLGSFSSRSVCQGTHSLLLQTVGRNAQEQSRAVAGRQDLRWSPRKKRVACPWQRTAAGGHRRDRSDLYFTRYELTEPRPSGSGCIPAP